MNNLCRISNHRKKQQVLWIHRGTVLLCAFIVLIIVTFTAANHMFSMLGLEPSIQHVNQPNDSMQIYSYKISSGDTLWRLASRTAVKGEDVRDRIIAIRSINNLSASQILIPGQTLQIPVKSFDNNTAIKYTLNIRFDALFCIRYFPIPFGRVKIY
jgi:hypothetical protein